MTTTETYKAVSMTRTIRDEMFDLYKSMTEAEIINHIRRHAEDLKKEEDKLKNR